MIKMQALGSGSNGNCFAVHTPAGTLLIDAGISRSRIITGLKQLDIDPKSVLAVLITHAHSDHIIGLPVLSSTLDFRVIATPNTIEEIRKKAPRDSRYARIADEAIGIPYGGQLKYGSFMIHVVPAFHDIAGSCGFQIDIGHTSLCYTTDTGSISDQFQEMMRESDYLIIESNHDKQMLADSRRPAWLKRRIRETHLSNDETLNVLKHVVGEQTKMVALAHLSGACNSPEEVIRQVHRYNLDSDTTWDWVVCTRDARSSLISEIRQTLLIEGGLNNRILPELDLDLEPRLSDLDSFFSID